METKSQLTGWIRFNTYDAAETLVEQINSCLGFPTPDGKTQTWAIPSCLQNDYSPNDTDQGYFVIIKDECVGCLTDEQKAEVIETLPFNIACGTPEPSPSGDTMNYL